MSSPSALVARSLRRAVAAALASEERFRDVATSASDWIFETDRELRLTYLSARFAELTGLPVEPMLGCRLTDVVAPDLAGSAAWNALAGGATAEPIRDLHGTIHDAEGQRRHR